MKRLILIITLFLSIITISFAEQSQKEVEKLVEIFLQNGTYVKITDVIYRDVSSGYNEEPTDWSYFVTKNSLKHIVVTSFIEEKFEEIGAYDYSRDVIKYPVININGDNYDLRLVTVSLDKNSNLIITICKN